MKNDPLDRLTQLIAKMPGLGPKSARRVVLQMLQNPGGLMLPMAEALRQVANSMTLCENCGNIDTNSPCYICSDEARDHHIVCVVETVADLWAIERLSSFKGVYHVLGGTLSALAGRTPDKLNIERLKDRVVEDQITEMIIATNATLDGQTTAHYILELLRPYGIRATRPAHGIPMGAELDYMDEGTLALALNMRQDFY